jgi:hypothetical protein
MNEIRDFFLTYLIYLDEISGTTPVKLQLAQLVKIKLGKHVIMWI